MSKLVKTILHFFILLSFGSLKAQIPDSLKKNFSIGIYQYYGSLVAIVPKTTYIRDSYSSFTEISISRQTNGSKKWHRQSNYPQVGISLVYGNPGSKEHVGKSITVFPFVNFAFIKKSNFKSSLRIGTGITWIEKPYHVSTNHKNTLIGSHFNNNIHVSQENEFRLSKSLFAIAGFAFVHISNGGIKLPNFGLNIPSLTAGLRYSFNEKIIKDTTKTIIDKKIKLRLLLSSGLKQTPWAGSPRYVVGVLGAELIKPLSPADYIGSGVNLFYDPSLTKDPSGILKTTDKTENIQIGVHAFYERKVGRLSIPIQLGFYVLNAAKRKSVYQNIGMRYQLSPPLSVFYNLKAHAGKADYIHAGLSYTF